MHPRSMSAEDKEFDRQYQRLEAQNDRVHEADRIDSVQQQCP